LLGLDHLKIEESKAYNNQLTENEINIVQNCPDDQVEKSWLVVRSLKTTNMEQGYKLCIGDILKIGRIKF